MVRLKVIKFQRYGSRRMLKNTQRLKQFVWFKQNYGKFKVKVFGDVWSSLLGLKKVREKFRM